MTALGARRDRRTVLGVRTHALVRGAGDPIVLVPGLGCSHLTFARLQAALSREREVWAYDPPGYGLSPAGPGSFLEFGELARHLAAWLDAAGLRGTPVLGHSQGAEVAVAVSARDGAATGPLVLVAPTGIPEYPSLAVQAAKLFLDFPEERAGYFPPLAASYLLAGPRRFLAHWTGQLRHETASLLPLVKQPALVLYGTRDRVVSPRLAAAVGAALPQAVLRAVPDGGHGMHDSQAPEVARLTLGFLSRLPAAGPPAPGAGM